MEKILDKINTPSALKNLTQPELCQLAVEIRERIIEVLSKTGGHLASNLGVVELTLALHRVFDSPHDKIIWDVGHQAYVHKLLTGRQDIFPTVRQFGGMSGFPKRYESEHDIYDTGHSSTSISAGLGLACARDLAGEHYHVIAVIGDGALTGGIAYEAMNQAGILKTNLIVILNDNQMSISKNIGSMSLYLNRLRTASTYFQFKAKITKGLNRIPIIGKEMFHVADKMKEGLKYMLVQGIMFEELGFKYLGPIDGHNEAAVEETLKRAKLYKNQPVLVHVRTKKGNGYRPAEAKPNKFHGVGPFDKDTGESIQSESRKSFSSIAGDTLTALAERDEKIVAITAAMPDGTGIDAFAKKFPKRFFDVGIAEQHAVSFSAGLALGGFKPFFFVYSTFLQRAYDQVLEDASLQNLNIKFCIDRAGLVGNDGETHHGVFDIAYLSSMPNLTIMSPKDGQELQNMIAFASNYEGPVAIRYPRDSEKKGESLPSVPLEWGKAEILLEGTLATIIAEGKMVKKAMAVAERFRSQGLEVGVINIRFIKPLDLECLRKCFANSQRIYTLEDSVAIGGLGNHILGTCIANQIPVDQKLQILAFDDLFIPHGNVEELYQLTHMDNESIYQKIKRDLKVEID